MYYVDQIANGVRVNRTAAWPSKQAAEQVARVLRLQYAGRMYVVTAA